MIDGFSLGQLTIGYRAQSEWTAALYVENLTDEVYFDGGNSVFPHFRLQACPVEKLPDFAEEILFGPRPQIRKIDFLPAGLSHRGLLSQFTCVIVSKEAAQATRSGTLLARSTTSR